VGEDDIASFVAGIEKGGFEFGDGGGFEFGAFAFGISIGADGGDAIGGFAVSGLGELDSLGEGPAKEAIAENDAGEEAPGPAAEDVGSSAGCGVDVRNWRRGEDPANENGNPAEGDG